MKIANALLPFLMTPEQLAPKLRGIISIGKGANIFSSPMLMIFFEFNE
jgi:hypothetical protein